MWINNYENRLFVVKRKYAEEYHTGSYSNATPKLYKMGYAKTAAKSMNGEYDSWNEKWSDTPLSKGEWIKKNPYFAGDPVTIDQCYQSYLDNHAKGPWVVAEVQFTASEIES